MQLVIGLGLGLGLIEGWKKVHVEVENVSQASVASVWKVTWGWRAVAS